MNRIIYLTIIVTDYINYENRLDIVKLLLEERSHNIPVDVNILYNNGSVLYMAYKNRYIGIVNSLLDNSSININILS